MRPKWVHLKIKGWYGVATVIVPYGATVTEFKWLVGADPLSLIMIPAKILPLPSWARLYDFVQDFDTIYLEPR